jgi:hypothetical protein
MRSLRRLKPRSHGLHGNRHPNSSGSQIVMLSPTMPSTNAARADLAEQDRAECSQAADRV